MPIQPQVGAGEPPLRWNWDSPLIVSPHAHTAAVFRREQAVPLATTAATRGRRFPATCLDNSTATSCRSWARSNRPTPSRSSVSTSFFGNITALSESPKKEGLIYVGTDDGLIQVTEDGGKNWRRIELFPGVPEGTYVARLFASQHDAMTVFAAFDNHKNADFAPYLLKSTDAGKTWTKHVGDLPARGSVLAFAEDHVESEALVRRHRVRAVFHDRRRSEVAAPARPADGRRERLGYSETHERSAGRHVWPRVLCPRRLFAVARGDEGIARQAGRRLPGPRRVLVHAH